jgi:sugar lactone lactonase YvrE
MKLAISLTITALLLTSMEKAGADQFFVTNLGVNTITRYDDNGFGFNFTNATVLGPNGIALDVNGNVYVTTNANTIEVFSPAGIDLGVFASTGLNLALGLAFDASGNLYAANFAGNTIEKFSPTGVDLGVFANVIRPTGLAFDAAGNLYVANFSTSIMRFAPNGTQLSSFTSLNLNNPQGIAFDSLGNLYAANSGSDTIEVFSPNGVDLGSLATTQEISGPVGLAFDSSGNLYVVNSLAATITKFSPDGFQSTFAQTEFMPAFIAIQRSPTLVNISTRVNVMTGDNVLDGGFIIVGPGTKTILIRGLGPSLASSGITGVLADPLIELHGGSENAIIASNDNWKNNQQAEIEATGIPPTDDAESALIVTLSEGAYTVIQRGKGNTTGVGLIEIYDLGVLGFGPELANISTRGFVGTGSDVMIAGFIAPSATGGSGNVLLRALGPSLGSAGVSDPLADPILELHDSNGVLIASNDNWKSDQQSEIEATGIPPTNDLEAAIFATLTPGSYTAIESGKNGGTGVGLVEVYNLH